MSQRPLSEPELSRIRTVAAAAASLLLAGATLVAGIGGSLVLTTGLGVSGVVALAAVLILSVAELAVAKRQASTPYARRGRRRQLAIVVALAAMASAATVALVSASPRETDVKIDKVVGTGPYIVNGTCKNSRCFLYERQGPSQRSEKVARIAEGRKLTIACQARGAMLTVPGGGSNIWDRLYEARSGPYVSDFFTDTPGVGEFSAGIPRCPSGSQR